MESKYMIYVAFIMILYIITTKAGPPKNNQEKYCSLCQMK